MTATRTLRKLCVLTCIAVLVVVEIFHLGVFIYDQRVLRPTPVSTRSLSKQHTVVAADSNCLVRVLTWRYWYNGDLHYDCPELNCKVRYTVTTSWDALDQSDVVIFHHGTPFRWSDMLAYRPPQQKWVFFSLEPPSLTHDHAMPPPGENPYDYLMTYRREAHFRTPYGHFDRSNPSVGPNDHRNWAENKTKGVAWAASNCRWTSWSRTQFVKNLQKYVRVDTFGRCGTNTLPRRSGAGQFERYKFYLALENIECRDYISEKFWKNALLSDAIPIVYGANKNDYELVAPPGSFIYARDFASVHELGDYIKMLDANDQEYNKYFEWKKLGSVMLDGEDAAIVPRQVGNKENICNVARRVLSDREAAKNGSYVRPWMPKDWNAWWSGFCHESNGILFSGYKLLRKYQQKFGID